MSEQKPDGYCAWHPEHGWSLDADDFYTNQPAIGANCNGWIYKPVNLIDSTELERLRAVEEWAKKTYESLIEMGQAQRMLGRDILAATIDVITDDFNKLLEGGGK